ncbi:high-affinity Zn(2+) transporter zrt1 [Linnemannia schmuckeri]|uniref:High-affinity Zn(2+) transporter zrt1 n=1 Tax=Linnemannia schmuckeri TaxID=64567 RepID=A0A9P5VCR0_9FUNG|nr:high-affinity Zn(2+) transporter zrt1 [Linnemannia schmuckeri]
MACQHRTSLPLQNNNNDDHDDYNLKLHILGIFTILAASTLGVLMPLLATKIHSFQLVPTLVLTLGRQFGTGVILATALIHMLPTAMSNLSSPCLGDFFAKDYPAMGGLLALTSSLLMHWIEFMATEFNQVRVRDPVSAVGQISAAGSGAARTMIADGHAAGRAANGKPGPTSIVVSRCPGHTVTVTDELECHRDHGNEDSERALLLAGHHTAAAVVSVRQDPCLTVDSQDDTQDHHHRPPMTPASSGFYGAVSNMTHARPIPPSPPSQHQSQSQSRRHHHHHHHYHHHDHNQHLDQEAVLFHSHLLGLALPSDAQKRISTYILEAGVAAHSVIIGVTLGISSGSEFTGLLIALLFHQFFEGFALGARIADLNLERTSTHYFLALIFALTTPAGVVIGTLISQQAYAADSATSLMVEGVLDAISTGILLYMGYVTLLAVEFNLNSELLRQSPRVKSWCFFALWTGAGVMALLGRFA